jgi:death-on-curing protein
MNKRPWRWVQEETVLAIHDRQLAEHGGLDGLRSRELLESALAKPRNQAVYAKADYAALAAAYAYGISRNHVFQDGNKRTAWVTAKLFLADNGVSLSVRQEEIISVMHNLAAGNVTEHELAAWIRDRIK